MNININWTKRKLCLVLFTVLALIPLFIRSPFWLSALTLSFYYAILCLSWDLVMGYTGQFSWGQQAFAAIGGYTSVLSIRFLETPVVVGFLFGAGMGLLAGLLLGLICLKMKGFYLCLASWVFGEVIYIILCVEQDITGGTKGIFTPYLFSGSLSSLLCFYTGLGIVVFTFFVLDKIVTSRIGLRLTAIRDDEDAAEVLGVDTYRWKVFSFSLSGLFSGIAGVFFAHFNGMIAPSICASFPEMAYIFAMVILGGIGTLIGPIIGALIVVMLLEYLRGVSMNLMLLIFAIILLIMIRFARGGIIDLLGKLKTKFLGLGESSELQSHV